MRNLIHHSRELEDSTSLRPIPRQQRQLTERDFTRHVREAGRKERTLILRVRRAEKAAAE